ncbi:MAG: alpha/beta hydrolase [Chloroflexi bacterium]|nr:alpha/beta hydrolase [Chloroflexota bacterium]
MVEAHQHVQVDEGVVYGRGGGRELRGDVYTPPGGRPQGAPGVVIVHGGGWREGDRSQLRGYGLRLARQGYVCAAIEYRLLGEAPWPAQIEDVKAAIRWMRANAERLGVDPNRIAITGNSAGGHLSLLAAGTPGLAEFEGSGGHEGVSSAVAASIAFYPVTSFVDRDGRLHSTYSFLFGDEKTPERARAASPTSHVRAGFPPALLIHGNRDEVVPPAQSTGCYEALRAAGVPAELHVFADQPHGFDADPRFARHCADVMALFLERYVRAGEPAPTAGVR